MKWERSFESGQMVIRRVHCDCKDCSATELSDPPRCVVCGCKIAIQLTDEADGWEENPLWLDEQGEPIRRDEVLHTAN